MANGTGQSPQFSTETPPISRSAKLFRLHLIGFVVVNGAALAIATWWGSSDIAAWVLIGSGAALLLHQVIRRSLTVTDDWADVRAHTALRRNYERSNVEGVLRDFGMLKRRAPDASPPKTISPNDEASEPR